MEMNRREALQRLAVLMGATLAGLRLEGSAGPVANGVDFTAAEIALLDEIGDTIIPETDVPGAKAAGIGAFIAMMLRDCYLAREQVAVRTGLAELAQGFEAQFGTPFVRGSARDRTAFLNEIDRTQKLVTAAYNPPRYFRILKELTVLGYFSSEIGGKQALQYVEVPGRFDGSAPYQKGDHHWWFA